MENNDKIKNSSNGSQKTSILSHINRVVNTIEENFSIICFSVMSIVVFVSVIFRYVLKWSLPWGEELARYLMIWGILIGVSIGVRKRTHMGLEIIIEKMPQKIQKPLVFISHLIIIGTFGFLTIMSFLMVLELHGRGQTSPSLSIPMYLVYSSLLIGFLLSTIRAIQIFWQDMFSDKSKDAANYKLEEQEN